MALPAVAVTGGSLLSVLDGIAQAAVALSEGLAVWHRWLVWDGTTKFLTMF
jgi:hypothetical protein